MTRSLHAQSSATRSGWSRTPWVGWCVDSCRPGTRCQEELLPLS